jgi:hypothetical protein
MKALGAFGELAQGLTYRKERKPSGPKDEIAINLAGVGEDFDLESDLVKVCLQPERPFQFFTSIFFFR